MIVRDAEAQIGDSLSSVQDVADEIIVLDTGSADRTIEIAQRLATKVLHRAWDHDFSAARNFARSHATGDWIFWLDAGERLSTEGAQALRALIDGTVSDNAAYLVMVELEPQAVDLASEQIAQIRLLPNRSELQFVGRVREDLRPAMEAAGLGLELAPLSILRSAAEHHTALKHQKAQRNMLLAEMEYKDRGGEPRLLLVMAESAQTLGNNELAEHYYRQALAGSRRGTTDMLDAYYGLLTTLDGRPECRATQIELCLAALDVFPLDAQLLCAMGSYLQADGRVDLASRAFQAAASHGQVNPEIWHLTALSEVATVCWSLTLELQSMDDEARAVLIEASRTHPQSLRIRRQLLDLYIKQDCRQEALALADELCTQPSQREPLRAATRGACLASKQNYVAAINYLKTAYDGGCRDSLCLRWLSVSLLSTGDSAAALPILHQWRERSPGNIEVEKYLATALNPQTGAAGPLAALSRAETSTEDQLPQRFRVDTHAGSVQPAPHSARSNSGTPAPTTPGGLRH